jgi:hypothetical protein
LKKVVDFAGATPGLQTRFVQVAPTKDVFEPEGWGMGLFTKRTPYNTIKPEEFENRLEMYFEKVRPGSFATVKTAIGGAWAVVIDEMYNDYAARINPDNLMKMMAECAELLLGTLKALAERDGRLA